MSILIKGMEIPPEGFVEVLIRDDGTAQQTGQSYRIDGTDYYTPYVGEMPVIYKAVPVPPHGDLIDRTALLEEMYKQANSMAEHGREFSFSFMSGGDVCTTWWNVELLVNDAPTVIPVDVADTNVGKKEEPCTKN